MPTSTTGAGQFYIGGHWISSAQPYRRYQVVSPATGQIVADVPDPGERDAAAAVAAARRAFDTGPWPDLPLRQRIAHLQRR